MSVTDSLSLNANKVAFSSTFSTQQILSSDDTATFTLSLGANTTLVTRTVSHGQTVQPLCIGIFSIDNTNWYGLGANIFVSGQTDVTSCSAYTTATSVVFGAVNYGSAPTAKTVYIKYWLVTV